MEEEGKTEEGYREWDQFMYGDSDLLSKTW